VKPRPLLADSSGPLYERVRQTLERMALGRPLHDDTALPPEPALMDTLGVSRGTLRRAIEELTRDGLLVAEQGRGTFVDPEERVRRVVWKTCVSSCRTSLDASKPRTLSLRWRRGSPRKRCS
jgi:DNA-binding GntR family transcriptional regulator